MGLRLTLALTALSLTLALMGKFNIGSYGDI